MFNLCMFEANLISVGKLLKIGKHIQIQILKIHNLNFLCIFINPHLSDGMLRVI